MAKAAFSNWPMAAAAALLLALCVGSVTACGAEEPKAGKTQSGDASFYHPDLAGKKTASGERIDPEAMTAASKTLPLGAKAKVTNTESGKSVQVTVTDRGPFVKGRILDVSPKAAKRLDMKKDGVAPVKVNPVQLPPSND